MVTISMRKSSSMGSSIEVEDKEESQHSPLRFHSPLRSDLGDPTEMTPYASPDESPGSNHQGAEDSSRKVSVDKCTQWSPFPSPSPNAVKTVEKTNPVETLDVRPPVVVVNKAVRQDMMLPMTKVGLSMGGGGGGRSIIEEAGFRRSRGGGIVLKAALWFRVLELILCLISFSVMAADKTQGWASDSFDRYKEYRYCLSVTVIAFFYAGAQACYLAYQLMMGNHFVRDYIHSYFDFFLDQILAYLLVSASSSAATRVYDLIANWGGDKFTEMAGASVAMAFLAFLVFACSALISGYNLCTND